MNERIKELAKAAYIKEALMADPQWEENEAADELMRLMLPVFEIFAESIVKECEKVAKNPKWYSESPSDGWRNPIRHICNVMKEHFGVEE
jgi:hypothetical protein